ncbi:hypothetical protein P9112_009900 [Eukaryota sp. TZLM1-RC]
MKVSENLRKMRFLQKATKSKSATKSSTSVLEQWRLIKPDPVPEETVIPYVDTTCSKLIVGRFSFNGFNPSIEKLHTSRKRQSVKEEDVSTAEMLSHYEKNVKAPPAKKKRDV